MLMPIEVISKHINTDKNLANKDWQMVFACLSGHDPYEMALIFKNNHANLKKIFLARVKNPRSLLFDDLKQAFIKAGFNENILYEFIDIDTALLNNSNKFTLVCGSLYLAGEIRKNIVPMDCDEKLCNY
jgi:folylpolyglutamate synthase/dihydropteroate synthase